MSEKTNRVRGRKAGNVTEVPASEVKNAWHQFIDRVSQAREEIVVTRYGKPVMKLSPIDEPEDGPGIFGFLAGTVTAHGDLVAPTGEVWEADA
jgi:antitoxin (DNA-binding transcriptional repressor) of toxin-antitoxin stability system